VNDIKILNYRFHTLVCGNTVHPWLTRLVSALWIRLPPRTIWHLPKEARIAVKYHRQIVKAIRQGDGVLAGTLMKEHLQRSHKVLYGSREAEERTPFSPGLSKNVPGHDGAKSGDALRSVRAHCTPEIRAQSLNRRTNRFGAEEQRRSSHLYRGHRATKFDDDM
jgi:hypothetical protein